MKKKHLSILFLLILLFSVLLSSNVMSKVFKYPYPHAKVTGIREYVVIDLLGVLSGIRRLSADIAWIQLLQYYGTSEGDIDEYVEYETSWEMVKSLLGMGEHDHDHHHHVHHEDSKTEDVEIKTDEDIVEQKKESYPDFFKYVKRVVVLDPFFNYAYLYGAGALAWNLERPHEALEILNYGIESLEGYKQNITKEHNQPFWQFHLYMAAIVYRKEGKFDDMMHSLQVAVSQPNCPNIIKAILANIFEKQENYAQALTLWLNIYDTDDPAYREKSERKISKLRKILNI